MDITLPNCCAEVLVNRNVYPLCVLDPPGVWECVTALGKFQAVPFEDKADRTVGSVYRRYRTNNYAVLLVNNVIETFVIEFMHFDYFLFLLFNKYCSMENSLQIII